MRSIQSSSVSSHRLRVPIGLLFALGAWAQSCAAAEKIPLRFIDTLPVVQVQLGDVKADFLLDTGGQIGITVPAPLINGATKVTVRDEFQKTGDAAGHTFSAQKLTAASVALGSAQLGPVDGLVHYKWGLSVGPESAPAVTKKGVIGLKAFASKNLLLDVPNGSMTLYDKGGKDAPDVTGWLMAPFEYDARGVVVKLMVNGVPAAMSLDSAATTSMIRKDGAIFTKTKTPCKKGKEEPFCGMLTLPSIDSGGSSFGRLTVAVVQMGGVPFDGLLGIDFLRIRTVYLDFDAHKLYVREAKANKQR